GLGPSAQSYLDGCRFGNVEDLDAYQQALAEGRLPILETEHLSPEQQRREAIVFGLRLADGVDGRAAKTGEPGGDWEDRIQRLARQGLVEEQAGRIKLTDLGRRYADSVAVELL
nr:coproporphyrinogen III oxidase [Nitrospirota bacterium]